jgi:DNA mismatch endonuclease, patch repair protein
MHTTIKSRKFIRDGRAPVPDKVITSFIMSSIKSKNTKPELKLRKVLWENGLRGYRLHIKEVPGKPDIVFTRKKLAIFVNGCFWHRCPYCKPPMPKSHSNFWKDKFEKNADRDKKQIYQLIQAGWKTITIWECQIKDEVESVVIKINKRLNENN